MGFYLQSVIWEMEKVIKSVFPNYDVALILKRIRIGLYLRSVNFADGESN